MSFWLWIKRHVGILRSRKINAPQLTGNHESERLRILAESKRKLIAAANSVDEVRRVSEESRSLSIDNHFAELLEFAMKSKRHA